MQKGNKLESFFEVRDLDTGLVLELNRFSFDFVVGERISVQRCVHEFASRFSVNDFACHFALLYAITGSRQAPLE